MRSKHLIHLKDDNEPFYLLFVDFSQITKCLELFVICEKCPNGP